jgi:hypothetical protein
MGSSPDQVKLYKLSDIMCWTKSSFVCLNSMQVNLKLLTHAKKINILIFPSNMAGKKVATLFSVSTPLRAMKP